MNAWNEQQKDVCTRFGAAVFGALPHLKVGISKTALDGIPPLNGLRHAPEGDTTGWYIWGGEEFSEEPDFFLPMHAAHLPLCCPRVVPYLGLPPGWRFLISGDYEDVWYDAALLTPE